MNKRDKILLGCLVLLAFLSLACDIDRSGWGVVTVTRPVSNPAHDQHIQNTGDIVLEKVPTPTD